MTEVLQQSPSHFPSPSSSSLPNDGSHPHTLINSPSIGDIAQSHLGIEEEEEEEEVEYEEEEERIRKERDREGDQLSLLAFLVTAFRKSLIRCSSSSGETGKLSSMEIGWPSNVRHVAHVTFDRFNGFLGLPAEFEPEVPRRAPSASANVFGVSTESMQLSFDSRGNSVPTILLMMQRQLYALGGLQAEGIFRITAGNSQEEYVRDQLNRGVVPEGVDVHCLAGLIKAWFRELPAGVLDCLSPEQVMQSQTEEECAELVRFLPPTEAALLDWAINLMADVAQLEHLNKMNARNVAMVFAPNMTQMADPLTALMYAVQVMNFLKTLIVKTLRDREESIVESISLPSLEPSDDDANQSTSQLQLEMNDEETFNRKEEDKVFVSEEPDKDDSQTGNVGIQSLINNCPCDLVSEANELQESFTGQVGGHNAQSSSSNIRKGPKKVSEQMMFRATGTGEKSKKNGIVGRINSRTELVEAWR